MRIEFITHDDDGRPLNPPGFNIDDDDWIRPADKTNNGWAITISDAEIHADERTDEET